MAETPLNTDLTFFTNDPDSGVSLYQRFNNFLTDAQFFDVLVGYFRTSGFYRLYPALEETEKIRILVGKNVGKEAFRLYGEARSESKLDLEAHDRVQRDYLRNAKTELEHATDSAEVEQGVRTFIEWLKNGKLELRVHPSQNIHAKIYIARFGPEDRDAGRLITGSSNFSESGLHAQREFNVELKDSADIRFAQEQFEQLWKESVDVSEDFVAKIPKRTWLNDEISPYELYLKFLYEYFEEEINLDEQVDDFVPEGYLDLDYQKQAVAEARKILESYGGVFIADVVGLGKTYIAAQIARQQSGKKLVLCPPVLMDYWEDTFREFGVPGAKIESHGKLPQLDAARLDDYSTVIIDEAHRFRNELTEGYEKLYEICQGKKVVLVSATPLNNTVQDIYAQLKLFQIPKRSTIPGVRNLKAFFDARTKQLRSHSPGEPGYQDVVNEIAREVRENVLKYVMIRRTRTDVQKYFKKDLEKQGLSFPEVEPPHRLLYEYDEATDSVFDETMSLLRQLKYSRYTPLLYLEKPLEEFEKQPQRNLRGFMKSLIVKRLESSFHAFKKTLSRFIESYRNFIEMYESGTVYLSKDVKINDLWDAEDEEIFSELVEEGRVRELSSEDFREKYATDLRADLNVLEAIDSLWQNVTGDPKLEEFLEQLENDPVLAEDKLIVFTESSETGQYLFHRLNERYPGEILFYSSGPKLYSDGSVGKTTARDRIRENYDPSVENGNDDSLRVLITTDVLSEGINLHRSHVIVNYDLPWNPTKVLQRVGRVNRVGTEHDTIHVYNFFPTIKAEKHLNLEAIVKRKLQSFHDTLGEDAKYLTEDEEVSTHSLFGEQLYDQLNSLETYTGESEEEEHPELGYLAVIRDIRDEQPGLFKKIKSLPKKIRTARHFDISRIAEMSNTGNNGLLSFFRVGKLKKFFWASEQGSEEWPFFLAARMLECEPEAKKSDLPEDYYDRLDQNKQAFDDLLCGEEEPAQRGGRSNEQFVIKYLHSIEHHPKFTETDEQYLRRVIVRVEDGGLARQTTKKLKQQLETTADPMQALKTVHDLVPDAVLATRSSGPANASTRREVILSEYFVSGEEQ